MEIRHTVTIRASREQLYRTLTTAEGIAGWYSPETKAEPTVGALVECTFRHYGTLKFRVRAMTPNREVQWTVVQGPPEWLDSTLTFDLAEVDGKTEFTFSHAGLPDDYDAFSAFNYLWGQYVRSIKRYAETGLGEAFGSEASIAAGTTP